MRPLLLAVAVSLLLPAGAGAAGVRVTWPDKRDYRPGETMRVTVAANRATKVVFVRESATGTVLRVLARRMVRHGTIALTVGPPGRYALRVGNRTRHYRAGALCARNDGDRAQLRLAATSVRAGGTLPYTIVNSSTNLGCVLAGEGYRLERLGADGTWTPVDPQPASAIGLIVAPWKPLAKQAQIPADAPPGTYRVSDPVFSGGERIDLTAQFEVIG